ncbi:ABC transporter substrate-binding protein [Bradyrhizobium sp. 14AA]
MVGAASLAATTRIAAAPAGGSSRLAIVNISTPTANMREDNNNYYRVLFGELRRLGRIEGQNLTVERYGKEQYHQDRDALAEEVVRSNPDVINILDPPAIVFKPKTTTIPIVTISYDPVAIGLAQSMAHPGGNFTGVSVNPGPSIHGKRIALLREMFPAMSKLGCVSPAGAWENTVGEPVRAATGAAGISVTNFPVDLPGSATTYRNAIMQAARNGSDAIMMVDSPDALANRVAINEAIAEARIPSIQCFTESVEGGGLMAYAFDLKELTKHMAGEIDAILRGANPAEIPFYQVSKFDLSINLKAAKALGLTVPETLLATAAKVVE